MENNNVQVRRIADIKEAKEIPQYMGLMKNKRDVLFYLSWEIEYLKSNAQDGQEMEINLLKDLEELYKNEDYHIEKDFLELKWDFYNIVLNYLANKIYIENVSNRR